MVLMNSKGRNDNVIPMFDHCNDEFTHMISLIEFYMVNHCHTCF